MIIEDLEPEEDQRLEDFRSCTINHALLKTILSKLKTGFPGFSEETIIMIIGATGVGKTTLKNEFKKHLIKNDQRDNPGFITVADFTLAVHGNEKFDWKDFYVKALLALDEPLIAKKIDYQDYNIRRKSDGKLKFPSRPSVLDLRAAYISCLEHRKPLAMLLDEAQHLKKTRSGQSLYLQLV